MLKAVCLGYVVILNIYYALACLAMSWESFYPGYRVQQIASGPEVCCFRLDVLGDCARCSVRSSMGSLGFDRVWHTGFMFLSVSVLDGYLRIKSKYSGEESSEVFGAIVLSTTSLLVIAAMFAPAVRNHFQRNA